MSYKILLFDLDDTLLDFQATEINALKKLFRLHGYTFTDELFQVYNSPSTSNYGRSMRMEIWP
jgi:2-haloacid dehalogenase